MKLTFSVTIYFIDFLMFGLTQRHDTVTSLLCCGNFLDY